MIFFVLWLLAGAGIFFWNHSHTPYIGIRFTDQLIGFPISGGWLCVAIALYCLIRYFYRRRKDRQKSES